MAQSEQKSEYDEAGEPVKVYLRLRPMNKLEQSKRSRDCIELHNNPKIVTIDSPLQGRFDFTFDMVFDEYASQEEVYRESLAYVPKKLVEGIDCTVMAYGQSGSGKTHTMLGERLGVELNERATLPVGTATNLEDSPDLSKSTELTEGMIPRVVQHVFEQLRNTPDSVEYILRCSYVEIYLEKIQDLIQPWRENLRLSAPGGVDAHLVGASEVCCVEPRDVYALLARGNSYRTKSAKDRNTDSNRSHAVFSLRLEQTDRLTGKQKSSRLQMVDLAGSEVGKPRSTSRAVDSPSALEGKMINASLASLINTIRGVLSLQSKGKGGHNPQEIPNAAKLAKLLRPAFGEHTFTSIICTGSPSSYNIHETLNTIRFGQQSRQVINHPLAHEAFTTNVLRARMAESEKRNQNLTILVKMLAQECLSLKVDGKQLHSDKNGIWDAVEKLVTQADDVAQVTVSVARTDEVEPQKQIAANIEELEERVHFYQQDKEKVESSFRDLRSDIIALRRQNELLTNDRERLEREVFDAKEEAKNLSMRKAEVEHHLRTSQFREREAILFLRQFRTFYFRLLKNKAAHGSGSTKDITDEVSKKIPGVSDLSDLLDVDKVMMQSGIIERVDVGKDTNSRDYIPSQEARTRSAAEAKKAERKEFDLISSVLQTPLEAPEKGRVSISNPSTQSEFTFGQLTSYRQKLVESPAGRLAMQKERELEQDLTELAKKCLTLQNSVIAEKAMVEALSARQGAMGKMKTAQELNTLKQELERKTNDLHAIVWKMNELHLVNKTIDTKVENREQHVAHLEEHLANLQSKIRRLVTEKQEAEKRLRDENQALKQKLDGMTIKMWQLGELGAVSLQPWRSVVPFLGDPLHMARTDAEKRRVSLGGLDDDEIAGLVQGVPA